MSAKPKYLRDADIYVKGNKFLYIENESKFLLGEIENKEVSNRFKTISRIDLKLNNNEIISINGNKINRSNFFRFYESPFYNILIDKKNNLYGRTIIDYCIDNLNMPMYIGYYLGYGHSNEYLIHGKYKIVEGKKWNESALSNQMILESLDLKRKEYIRLSYISKMMHREDRNINSNNIQSRNNSENKNIYMSIFEKWLIYKKEKIDYVYSNMKINQILRNYIKKLKEKNLLNNTNKSNNIETTKKSNYLNYKKFTNKMSSYDVNQLQKNKLKDNKNNSDSGISDINTLNYENKKSRIKFYQPENNNDLEPDTKEWMFRNSLIGGGVYYNPSEWQYVKAIKDPNYRDLEERKIRIIEDEKRKEREILQLIEEEYLEKQQKDKDTKDKENKDKKH